MLQQFIQLSLFTLLIFVSVYFGGVTTLGRAYLEMGLSLLVGLLCVGFLFGRFSSKTLMTGDDTGKAFLLWLGIGSLSVITSIYIPESLSFWLVLAALYFVFLLILNTFGRKEVIVFFTLLISLAVVLSVYGLLLETLEKKFVFGMPKVHYLGRVTSTFINPNHFACFLGLIIPLIPYFWFQGRASRKVLIALPASVILTAFMGTFSWGGYVAFALSSFIYFLLYRSSVQRRKVPKQLFFLVPLCLLLFLLGLIFLGGEILPESKQYSFWQRKGIYLGIAQFILSGDFLGDMKVLFLGGGLNCFQYLFQGFYPYFDVAQIRHAHNEYLQLLMESGIFGLGAFGYFLFLLWKKAASSLANVQKPDEKILLIGIISSAIFFLTHAFFEFNLRIPANSFLFFSLISCLLVIGKSPERGLQEAEKKGVKGICSIFVLGLFGTSIFFLGARDLVVENMLVRAMHSSLQGQYLRAEELFELASLLNPQKATVPAKLGEYWTSRAFGEKKASEERKFFLRKAAQTYGRMLRKNPYLPVLYFQTGWAYAWAGAGEEAEAYFLKGLGRNKKMLTSYLERGKLNLYNKKHEMAAQDFEFLYRHLKEIPGKNRVLFFLNELGRILAPFGEIPELQTLSIQVNEDYHLGMRGEVT